MKPNAGFTPRLNGEAVVELASSRKFAVIIPLVFSMTLGTPFVAKGQDSNAERLRLLSESKKVAAADAVKTAPEDGAPMLAQNQAPPAPQQQNTNVPAPNPGPVVIPGPGQRPGGPPPQVGAETPLTGGAIQGDRVTLQFPLNPVNDILSIYERLIGKPIVKDSTVFEGPQVSLVTPTDVPRDEAIRLIEAALLVNGYILVAEPDAESVKVLLGGARAPGQSASFSEGVVIYTDPTTLPDGESLVGFFLELEFINPEEAATIFGNHVVLNEFGRITPVSSPAGLLITETTPIVRQLIRLSQIIDMPTEDAPLLTEFIDLQNAQANVVAQIIQAAMDARMEERERQSESGKTVSGQQRTQNGQPTPAKTDARPQDSKGSNNASVNGVGTADSPAAQLIPDDRLNRIMLVASPSDAAYIIDLIKQFDQPLSSPQPVERTLSHIKANDILPVIVDVLQDTGTGETQLPGGRQIDSRPTPVTSAQLASLTGSNTQQTQNNQNRNTNSATADTEVGGRQDQIAFPIDDVAPISVLVGKTRIIADRLSNTIIVMGSKENQQIVLDIIDRLDHSQPQVYLATVIGELTLLDDAQFGIDYIQRFIKFDGQNPNAGGITSGNFNARGDIITNDNIPDLRDLLVDTANTFGPAAGLNLYGQVGENVDALVTALEATNRFKVLSRPVVYTQNGKRAEITSGSEVPVPATSLSDTNNINAVQTSIEFKEVVLKLEVLPTINHDKKVTLDIVQINDRVIGQQLVANNQVPIIGKQELNTTVTIPNRSTIVLGGLISERDEIVDTGVPWLKNIPILGAGLKNNKTTKTRTELMIFIQPIVVMGDDDGAAESHDEDVRSKIGQDAAEVFPDPGVPTVEHAEKEIEEEERGPLKKFGRRLFGPKRADRPYSHGVPE